ncbi:hypothetical protein MVEN_01683900 [Mycena venus]|uniref:Uncharacterized protein n=1 Tax=Mycena venus TaxID=2733690 RepID=A0A8H6XP07_9AGAR|nr:hypothetical protein MVEN_01683900 [Mycena venus]
MSSRWLTSAVSRLLSNARALTTSVLVSHQIGPDTDPLVQQRAVGLFGISIAERTQADPGDVDSLLDQPGISPRHLCINLGSALPNVRICRPLSDPRAGAYRNSGAGELGLRNGRGIVLGL